jgi:hypothetical protein
MGQVENVLTDRGNLLRVVASSNNKRHPAVRLLSSIPRLRSTTVIPC